MSMEIEERIKFLEVALNNEARERYFYLKHKERTRNPVGKLIFARIAYDESEHYQRRPKLHKKLKEEGKWPDTILLKIKELRKNQYFRK